MKENYKADDKVEYEIGKQKFSHFELLEMEVEVLKETVNQIVEILDYNNLVRKETIEPKDFDEDEVFKRLEDKE